jgi:hypothetical protein
VQGRGRWPASGDGEREKAHEAGYHGAGCEDLGYADPCTDQRADAERGDTVPALVARDDPAGHRGLAAGQLLLAEADREREQRRAAEPGEAEGGDTRAWRVMRQRRDEREGDREQERQAMVGGANISPYWLLVRS